MAKVLLSLILLLTFMTATAAELSCSCVEETSIHQEKKDSKSATEHKEHCQHTCTQCHFAAVVPKVFLLKADNSISTLSFISIQSSPVKFSKSHFRPPIA